MWTPNVISNVTERVRLKDSVIHRHTSLSP